MQCFLSHAGQPRIPGTFPKMVCRHSDSHLKFSIYGELFTCPSISNSQYKNVNRQPGVQAVMDGKPYQKDVSSDVS